MRLLGFAAHALRLAGFSDIDVLTAGYTASELRDASFTAEELREVGLAESTLRVVGFQLEQQVSRTLSLCQHYSLTCVLSRPSTGCCCRWMHSLSCSSPLVAIDGRTARGGAPTCNSRRIVWLPQTQTRDHRLHRVALRWTAQLRRSSRSSFVRIIYQVRLG